MDENYRFLATFTEFGLKPQEARLYLATLKLGQATVRVIAEEAQVQRTFAYEVLDRLTEEGLVSVVEINGKQHYSAVTLEKFKALQKEKLARFEQILPEMKVIERLTAERPKVSFFEGKEGIFIAQSDTLNLPVGSEFLSFATGEGLYEDDPEFALQYIRRRVKRKIFVRSIAPDNPQTRIFSAKNKEHMRETRLVSPEFFPFANEIDIYGTNKVAIINLIGELMAVIIESESVARTMRSIFELSWRGAQVVGVSYENTN